MECCVINNHYMEAVVTFKEALVACLAHGASEVYKS